MSSNALFQKSQYSIRRLSASSPATFQKSTEPKKWHLYLAIGIVGLSIGSWYRTFSYERPVKHSAFVAFELLAKEPVSSTASIFTIKPKDSLVFADEYAKAWKIGVWNVLFKQPQIQIVRAYTPLPAVEATDSLVTEKDELEILRFLIRRDARGGEMSTYLHRLPIGSTIELRGPNIEYPIPDAAKNVVFVAGGTGIAPAMQIAHAMFDGLSDRQKNEKTLHILWGSRTREDCKGGVSDNEIVPSRATEAGISSWVWKLFGPRAETQSETKVDEPEQNAIVKQLQTLKTAHNGRIKVSYFVDEEKSYITSNTLRDALVSSGWMPAVHNSETSLDQTHVVISGPPGFITYIAGPKVWHNGDEKQGPLGGRLAQVLGKGNHDDVKVWKV
ncbi:mitochondrial peripheral inner membrane protein [Lithohypha guttulata]|nr:mitochondrial peripheral inner membrane protein [Lithohypha guttulata]